MHGDIHTVSVSIVMAKYGIDISKKVNHVTQRKGLCDICVAGALPKGLLAVGGAGAGAAKGFHSLTTAAGAGAGAGAGAAAGAGTGAATGVGAAGAGACAGDWSLCCQNFGMLLGSGGAALVRGDESFFM